MGDRVQPDVGTCDNRLAVRADVPMHVEVGDHAARDELFRDELAGERDTIGLRQLARDRELDLARELRVAPRLTCLDRVPQRRAVAEPFRRAVRQHYLGVDDAGLVREIAAPPQPLVIEPRHMFLKPTVTADFADRVGHDFHHRYTAEPNADTYLALLDLVEKTRAAIAELKPRDNIDIRSFIWVVGEYREGDERE